MVRIKHRYLLFNILYPDLAASPSHPFDSGVALSSSNTTIATSTKDLSSSDPLPPSYVLFSRPSPAHLTAQLLIQTLRTTISQVFGDHGLGVTQAGLKIVYLSPSTSTCILRVPRAYFRLVWASLTFMDSIPGAGAGAGARKGGGYKGYTNTNTNNNTNYNAKSNTSYHSSTTNDSVPCVVRVVRVSGTIRKSEEEVLRRARGQIVRAKREGRAGAVDSDNENEIHGLGSSVLLEGLVGTGQRRGRVSALQTNTAARVGDNDDDEDDDYEDYDMED